MLVVTVEGAESDSIPHGGESESIPHRAVLDRELLLMTSRKVAVGQAGQQYSGIHTFSAAPAV